MYLLWVSGITFEKRCENGVAFRSVISLFIPFWQIFIEKRKISDEDDAEDVVQILRVSHLLNEIYTRKFKCNKNLIEILKTELFEFKIEYLIIFLKNFKIEI